MESLHCEAFGREDDPSIVLLHGLLGSSRNWRSVAKAMSESHRVFALDLPEHGASPHGRETDLVRMRDQVGWWIKNNVLTPFVLCGHSLGGKVAMACACSGMENLQALVVVDVAPRDYPPEHHLPVLDAMLALDLNKVTNRKEADEGLAEKIPNWGFRQFLLTNLRQGPSGWSWGCNLEVLRSSIASLSRNPLSPEDSYCGPSLFLRGGRSGYLRSEHFSSVLRFFPRAEIVTLPQAGHDLHVDDKAGFLESLRSFLEALSVG